MRIASGTTDQYLYFVAVDSTDFTTRETGLSSFTVYRSRNGGAATAMTTPTVAEVSSANMPGVYTLLLDEDMTIGSGNDEEDMIFHITHAGMAPVSIKIELYRPKITIGNTLDVTSTGAAGIDWSNIENATTAVNLSGTNIDTDQVVASVSGAVGSVTGNVGGIAGTIQTLDALDTAQDAQHAQTQSDIAGLNDLSAAQVNAEVDTALADYDAPTNTEMVAAFTEIKGATWATTDTLEAIRDRGDAAWITATGFSTHSAADVRTEMDANSTQLAAIVGDTNELQTDWADGGRLDLILDARMPTTHISATLGVVDRVTLTDTTTTNTDMRGTDSAATAASLATTDGKVDAIKAKTDSLAFTVAGQVDANIQYVNDVQVTGDGQSGTEWGPA